MNSSKPLGVLAFVTLAGLGVASYSDALKTETKPPNIKSIKKEDIVEAREVESKATWVDGTQIFDVPTVMKDGSNSVDRRLEAPCKRRPKGISGMACMRVTADFKGLPPELNRYPAAEMRGPGCEPVACSVWLGEDADAELKTPSL